MVFNSFTFFIFGIVVFFVYWFVLQKHLRLQNLFLFVCSYVFYGWWDWRFLSLLFLTSAVDFFIGKSLGKTEEPIRRKWLMGISLAVNLGLLGFFKYYNFFAESLMTAFAQIGVDLDIKTLNIILPVGISFYTFQELSYTIDVYRRHLKPTEDFIKFGAFVSFFPQLVAGPIERAANLLPQFDKPRTFDYETAKDGVKQIIWGMFKKVVIADSCGAYVRYIFENYETLDSRTLALGAVLFAFQIYGDFSGYSDIALGTAKLFGFRLMVNFRYPYFSRDIAEFWRRWHISLSTWFRDYLYLPLGGSKGTKSQQVRNTMIVFLVSGFWHGANWTFIIWGMLNALYFLPLQLFGLNRKNLNTPDEGQLFPSAKTIFQIILTFSLTCLAWIFFRVESIGGAFDYIGGLFTRINYPNNMRIGFDVFLFIFIMLAIEWVGRKNEHPVVFANLSKPLKFAIYFGLAYTTIAYFNLNKQDFIYFQF